MLLLMFDATGHPHDDAFTVHTIPRNDDASRPHDANAAAAHGNDTSANTNVGSVGPRWKRKQRIFQN